MDMPGCYNPREAEERWYDVWEKEGCFSARADKKKRPFSMVIPPPNVTGILHMGHALNNTIQDILARYQRMKGREALWVPGTDHAGIATQNVVEKKLLKQGLSRRDLGREGFLREVWDWRREYGERIIGQLRCLGASCDWQRLRFTMDEDYSRAVQDAFERLYRKGLIYRGQRIINWCPRCRTALSDEEAAHKEEQGSLYYIRYPLSSLARKNNKRNTRQKTSARPAQEAIGNAEYITVATTRPETMLGDTAVAVNPKDKRYKRIIGQTVVLPLVGRKIKVIADSFVDTGFGSGAVKITPAHDPNDYQAALRHNLSLIDIMDDGGVLNDNAGKYRGLERLAARKAVVEDLKEQGLLDKVAPHTHSRGHCYRCSAVVGPRLSRQWFVRMKPLAAPAIDAVRKREIKFYPRRWTKVYLNWMNNIQDWCISRQIWWGHRLPVYYCRRCQAWEDGAMRAQQPTGEPRGTPPVAGSENQKSRTKGVFVSGAKPERCPDCGSAEIEQDPDVLDTWFSSWLWPFAVFGWPFHQRTEQGTEKTEEERELDYFYPTSVLVTAPEIIFFWVARMIMAGFEFRGERPFSDVYIHGTVRDARGRKMSKSLGNIIDPLQVISRYGADALRFSIISLSGLGQDIFLAEDKFAYGRNFANKIWNAARFIIANISLKDVSVDLCVYAKRINGLAEKWILSRLYTMSRRVDSLFRQYRLSDAAKSVYDFFWHDFCDWYIEIAKTTIPDKQTQVVLYKVLEKTLRIIHPFMPYLTEEIWHNLPGAEGLIVQRPWPHLQRQFISPATERDMQAIIDLIGAIRNIRAEWRIPEGARVDCLLMVGAKAREKMLRDNAGYIMKLGQTNKPRIICGKGLDISRCAYAPAGKTDVYIPLAGVVDLSREKARLTRQLDGCRAQFKAIKARLGNKDFLKKAPQQVVAKEKERRGELRQLIGRLEKNIGLLA
ncbi:MAG: valine--tRNA ligase [Candidatus Omnitrophota bacterium]